MDAAWRRYETRGGVRVSREPHTRASGGQRGPRECPLSHQANSKHVAGTISGARGNGGACQGGEGEGGVDGEEGRVDQGGRRLCGRMDGSGYGRRAGGGKVRGRWLRPWRILATPPHTTRGQRGEGRGMGATVGGGEGLQHDRRGSEEEERAKKKRGENRRSGSGGCSALAAMLGGRRARRRAPVSTQDRHGADDMGLHGGRHSSKNTPGIA